MKKLNKAMSVAVAAAMMVSLGACGNSADAAKDGTQSAGASGKVYNIGICQQLEHPALDQATQGFEDVLKEKARPVAIATKCPLSCNFLIVSKALGTGIPVCISVKVPSISKKKYFLSMLLPLPTSIFSYII